VETYNISLPEWVKKLWYKVKAALQKNKGAITTSVLTSLLMHIVLDTLIVAGLITVMV